MILQDVDDIIVNYPDMISLMYDLKGEHFSKASLLVFHPLIIEKAVQDGGFY